MEIALVVGLGGAVGAILRWWVGVLTSHLLAPVFLGTLVVNLVGSFMIGLLLIWFQGRLPFSDVFAYWHFGRIARWVHDLFGVFYGDCKYDNGWFLWPCGCLCRRDSRTMLGGNMGRGNVGPLSLSLDHRNKTMLDPQQLRRDTVGVAQQLLRRGYALDVEEFSQIEADRKGLQSRQQVLQKERNRNSKEIGRRKASGEDVDEMLRTTQQVGSELEAIEQQLTVVQGQLSKLLQGIPNIPHESVPEGQTEADNLEIRRWGEPREFEFEPQDHVVLGVELGMMDFDGAAKISGSRFVVLSGPLSRLQRALTQFMLDLHTEEHGYVETYVPFLVNSDALFGTGTVT